MLQLSDELNNFNYDDSSEFYRNYFDIESLTDEQKQDREDLSKEFESLLILVFLLLIALITNDNAEDITVDSIVAKTKSGYRRIISSRMYVDKELSQYIDTFSEDLVNNTLDNFKKQYTFSQARVQTIAVNESESMDNYMEYKEALISGKSQKTWVTVMDGRERPTHLSLSMMTIPIDELFNVGAATMRYPHDIDMAYEHPEELINCRCSIMYT